MQRLTYGLLLNQNSLARGKTVESYFFVSLSKCFLARETVFFFFFLYLKKEGGNSWQETNDVSRFPIVPPECIFNNKTGSTSLPHLLLVICCVNFSLLSLLLYLLWCRIFFFCFALCTFPHISDVDIQVASLCRHIKVEREICPPGCWTDIRKYV